MEPETVTTPVAPSQPVATPQVAPTEPSKFTPKSKVKLLPILGGVAVILFSIALGIVFFGKDKIAAPAETPVDTNTPIAEQAVGWPKYINADSFYEIGVPPKWTQIKLSPLTKDMAMFDAEGTATLQIVAKKDIATLDEYLTAQDGANKDTIKSKGSTQVKVGIYDGYERSESWPTLGLQVITTYVKIQDMLYTFTLSPSGEKSAVTNESIIRSYRGLISSFRLTSTAQLGLDLKEYTSTKVQGLAFSAFSLKYPQTWVLTEKTGDSNLEVSIYRNNYELTISQKAVGGAVCLFSDSPAFEGSSGDLRSKQFSEFNTGGGITLRRYFNANAGDKSTMFFCEKQTDGPYFQTPLSVGGLVYYVPAKYDADIIQEMDQIVKSITLTTPSPSPSPTSP